MFWLSRWTYSGVPGCGRAACAGAASARARRAARRHVRPIDGIVTRSDATQNACVACKWSSRRREPYWWLVTSSLAPDLLAGICELTLQASDLGALERFYTKRSAAP
jgi:hypothetical protein